MSLLVNLVLFLASFSCFLAQDPRKRAASSYIIDWPDENDLFENDQLACTGHGCIKRSEADGPFWANRGKKDPKYLQSRLYAQEPTWVYLSDDHFGYNEPFFVTRGKRRLEFLKRFPWLGQDKRTEASTDPFFAARGKKGANDF